MPSPILSTKHMHAHKKGDYPKEKITLRQLAYRLTKSFLNDVKVQARFGKVEVACKCLTFLTFACNTHAQNGEHQGQLLQGLTKWPPKKCKDKRNFWAHSVRGCSFLQNTTVQSIDCYLQLRWGPKWKLCYHTALACTNTRKSLTQREKKNRPKFRCHKKEEMQSTAVCRNLST